MVLERLTAANGLFIETRAPGREKLHKKLVRQLAASRQLQPRGLIALVAKENLGLGSSSGHGEQFILRVSFPFRNFKKGLKESRSSCVLEKHSDCNGSVTSPGIDLSVFCVICVREKARLVCLGLDVSLKNPSMSTLFSVYSSPNLVEEIQLHVNLSQAKQCSSSGKSASTRVLTQI